MWLDLMPALVGGLASVLGLHLADAYLINRKWPRRRG
jgi:hypothetical protein